MLRKILVANRGEIAVRIMRTCREMGIGTVAVYSEPDRTALHVSYADEAYPIGPAPSSQSYLDAQKILDVARRAGCDGIHPGYGFLSERAYFARMCAEAGVTFIGPAPYAIEQMGEKTLARRTMIAAGVPVVPGTERPLASLEEAVREGSRIGFPLMLKAAAGGGGKGMRLVHGPDELEPAFLTAQREATAAFGDGSVYLEKYIEEPRHIELQVFGDHTGRVLHLNERECSIQRRHQKVVEESPSPVMEPELRARMGQVAVRAAEAVQYIGAGTCEFLVDKHKNFYFLEMNTRLQVEHPVTELTTGFDLVREQIRVASGLPMDLQPTAPRGHAIEVRIYAEDADQGFIPAPGRLTGLRQPSGYGVRVDSGVYAGFEVTPHYDPMLAKLAVWAPDRATAIRRMDRALSEYVVDGITTNVAFLRRIMQHPAYAAGDTTTAFIAQHLATPKAAPPSNLVDVALIAAAVRQHEHALQLAARASGGGGASGDEASRWRALGRDQALRLRMNAS
jgi:acetyl-CoA carboxylase biotin carboxylase subunit